MRGQTFHSFGEAREVLKLPRLRLPNPSTLAPEELREKASEIAEDQDQLRQWAITLLTRMDRRRAEVEAETDQRKRRIVGELAERANQEELKALNEYLRGEEVDPFHRRAVWLASLEHEFSRELRTREEAETLLGRLVKEGYLTEDPTGSLKAYDKTYAISRDSLFEEPEVAEVHQTLTGLLSRVFREVGKAREQRAQELRSQATINWQELLEGKPGKFVLDVSPEEVKKPDGSTAFWRRGGTLLVQSNGQRVFPLRASGGIEGVVKEAKDLRVSVLLYTLSWDSLSWDFLATRAKLDEPGITKTQLIWHLLKRGQRAKEEAKRIQATREELAAKATVTPEEWFLKRGLGTCLVELSAPWEVASPEGQIVGLIFNLFFLVSREEKEGAKRIRIAEAPDHLGNFFTYCMEEYTEEGNRYEGVPYPLWAVLQAAYGQVAKSAQINNSR